ncbi:hypothetical protein Ahy_B01g055404 [Arachis hypogaea]|uniref:Uncharacterized protein n=1 Tax=Arachis hypogaea TaxID=3818 RepID=A0A445AW30_ARAHY|nr:hypothetical protein Ahy_B01g055404 [Arachis hypogaea]
MNSDSKEDFEITYEAGDEDEDGDVGVEAAAENVVVHPAVSQPMNVPPFMRNLDFNAMNAPEFLEYANIGVADPEDEEFKIGMEYSSRKSVVAAIRSYTIFRGVNYNVFESEPQTFYAKYKTYGRGCDWLIRASLIRKKDCWEIPRYNDRHTCTMEMILQDHSMLDSNTVAEAIRLLGIQGRWRSTTSTIRGWKSEARHMSGAAMPLDLDTVLTGARNLCVLALVRATYYQLNEIFMRKSAESHKRKRTRFTYSVFSQQQIEANMQRVGNIVVHRFDRRNKVFEVREMPNGKRLDGQLYMHDVYKMTEVRKVYRFEFVPLGDAET